MRQVPVRVLPAQAQSPEDRPDNQTVVLVAPGATGRSRTGRIPGVSSGPGQTLTCPVALLQPEQKPISQQGWALMDGGGQEGLCLWPSGP